MLYSFLRALAKRGYTEEEIEKICYKNVWRVWKATEDFADKACCNEMSKKEDCTMEGCSV